MSTRRTRGGALRRGVRSTLLGVAMAVGLSGCGFSIFDVPLPGGADTGDDPILVMVEFEDALDLVPQSSVKVADVTVGRVASVTLNDWHADVEVEIRRDTDLPDNAIGEIRQTSLLGEKFVSLGPPAEGSQGSLETGDTIPLSNTGKNPEIEEVLGALSLLLNGGGVAQLKTIFNELNIALDGREPQIKELLTTFDTFAGQLNDNKEGIVAALESVNQLAISVNQQKPAIVAALEELPASVNSLNGQRDDLVRMLQALDRLSDVGVRVIRDSKAGTIDTLENLRPVLTELRKSGNDFPDAISTALTYPFIDQVVGRNPAQARSVKFGDYVNLDARLDLDFNNLPELPVPELPEIDGPVGDVLTAVEKCLRSGDPTSNACLNLGPNQIDRLCNQATGASGNQLCSALRDTLDTVTGAAGDAGEEVRDTVSAIQRCINSGNPDSNACSDLTQKQIIRVCNQVANPNNSNGTENAVCGGLLENFVGDTDGGEVRPRLQSLIDDAGLTGALRDALGLGGGGGGGGSTGGGGGGGIGGAVGGALGRAGFGPDSPQQVRGDSDLATLLLWGVSNP